LYDHTHAVISSNVEGLGICPALFAQAKRFSQLAGMAAGSDQEGFIRAAIVFSLMAVEAHFSEVVKGYIQGNQSTLDPQSCSRCRAG